MYDCPQCGPTSDTPDEHARRHSGSAGLVDVNGAPLAPPPTASPELVAEVDAVYDNAGVVRIEITLPGEDVAFLGSCAALLGAILLDIGPDKLAELVDVDHRPTLEAFVASVPPEDLMAMVVQVNHACAIAGAHAVLTAEDGIERTDTV